MMTDSGARECRKAKKAAIAKRNEDLAASSTAAEKWRAEKEAGVKSK
jgi:hypothetical protein